MISWEKRKHVHVFIRHISFTLTWNSLSNFSKLFSPMLQLLHFHKRYFTAFSTPKSYTTIDSLWMWPLHECGYLQTEDIWKPLYSSLTEQPEVGNRKIAATEALKKIDELKSFIEVNGSDHLNLIFNELIENVEQRKLKNQKQSDIRSFLRSWNIFYLYCLLASYEKNPPS